MQIKVNDYEETEHFRAICEDCYNISRTCGYDRLTMSHIHNTSEILFVESGEADYYIAGKKYHVEPYDILVIGAMEFHRSVITDPPYQRYGLTIKPAYLRGMIPDKDLQKVFSTPPAERFVESYKHMDPKIFAKLIGLLQDLAEEQQGEKDYRAQMQRGVLTQTAVLLFRVLRMEREAGEISAADTAMREIKDHIDLHFQERLTLETLSRRFYLHPSTISKEFKRCCGHNLNKYINMVRICRAASLLETGTDSVAEISVKCGYESENTFLRQFRSIMGMSPLQYRKSMREWMRRMSEGK